MDFVHIGVEENVRLASFVVSRMKTPQLVIMEYIATEDKHAD